MPLMRRYTVHVRGGRAMQIPVPVGNMRTAPVSGVTEGATADEEPLGDDVVQNRSRVRPAGERAAASGRPGRLPVLVPEGFTWGGLLFGPLWFAVHGAWLTAVVDAALWLLAAMLLPLALPALLLLQGLLGQDIRRWHLRRRGAVLGGVVVAPGREAALVRLLDARPDWRSAGPRTGFWMRRI